MSLCYTNGVVGWVFWTYLFLCSCPVLSDEHEYRLYKDLLRDHNALVRPVKNHTDAVGVTLTINLQQIVDVDEQNQVIEINSWLNYAWYDYKLKWNTTTYGGVSDVRFPVGKIWKPDVLLYNSVATQFDSSYHSNHVVYSNGYVNWVPPGIFRISCKINIRWFPFDDQSCYLKFGSWSYSQHALNLTGQKIDISEYVVNGEWCLLDMPVVTEMTVYPDYPNDPYPYVKFYLNIRRRTLYYGFNLIIPSLLISLMTVLGFTLPPGTLDAGEKITLEITILLSICFFLSMVASMTPPTSEAVPLIGTFFTCCMMVVSASVVFTVVVLNLHYRTPDSHEMGDLTRTLLLNWLPWLLMMKRPGHTFSLAEVMKNSTGKKNYSAESVLWNIHKGDGGMTIPSVTISNSDDSSRRPSISRLSSAVEDHRKSSFSLENRMNQCIQPLLANPNMVDPGVHALILMMQRIQGELKFITKRMEKEDEDSDAENDWKFAAMVVDRLCLFIFSAFIVASTCGIIFSAENLSASFCRTDSN